MKKIILLALTALMMVGCSEETDKSTKLVQFKILQIDSCEYLKVDGYYGYTHKGNCQFCKERDSIKWEQRKKELLEELVTKLKEE